MFVAPAVQNFSAHNEWQKKKKAKQTMTRDREQHRREVEMAMDAQSGGSHARQERNGNRYAAELFNLISRYPQLSERERDDTDVADCILSVWKRLLSFKSLLLALDGADSSNLSEAEVKEVRHLLAKEYSILEFLDNASASHLGIVQSFKALLASAGSKPIMKRSEFSYMRQMIRAATQFEAIPTDTCVDFLVGFQKPKTKDLPPIAIREWFALQGRSERPSFTAAVVDGSNLMLSQGPNGGHSGSTLVQTSCQRFAKRRKTLSRALFGSFSLWRDNATARIQQQCNRSPSHMREWLLNGSDINRSPCLKHARDDEVSGFLSDCVQMGIGLIVSNGFTHSYDMSNIKSITRIKGPYLNVEAHPEIFDRSHPSYRRSCPRDFFNFFGDPDGDDGIDWKDVSETEKEANINELHVVSKIIDQASNVLDKTARLYELVVSWKEEPCLCCCGTTEKSCRIRVLHIETHDQGPAMLSYSQTRLLLHALMPVDSASQGILVHCAGRIHWAFITVCASGLMTVVLLVGGIGRTGNLCYALSEILCGKSEIPANIFDKLLWLREWRKGTVQSPEQVCVLQRIVLLSTNTSSMFESLWMGWCFRVVYSLCFWK